MRRTAKTYVKTFLFPSRFVQVYFESGSDAFDAHNGLLLMNFDREL